MFERFILMTITMPQEMSVMHLSVFHRSHSYCLAPQLPFEFGVFLCFEAKSVLFHQGSNHLRLKTILVLQIHDEGLQEVTIVVEYAAYLVECRIYHVFFILKSVLLKACEGVTNPQFGMLSVDGSNGLGSHLAFQEDQGAATSDVCNQGYWVMKPTEVFSYRLRDNLPVQLSSKDKLHGLIVFSFSHFHSAFSSGSLGL